MTRRPITVPELRRLLELRRAGLSDTAVAIVMNLDYGLSLTGVAVRGLRNRHAPGLVGSKSDAQPSRRPDAYRLRALERDRSESGRFLEVGS